MQRRELGEIRQSSEQASGTVGVGMSRLSPELSTWEGLGTLWVSQSWKTLPGVSPGERAENPNVLRTRLLSHCAGDHPPSLQQKCPCPKERGNETTRARCCSQGPRQPWLRRNHEGRHFPRYDGSFLHHPCGCQKQTQLGGCWLLHIAISYSLVLRTLGLIVRWSPERAGLRSHDKGTERLSEQSFGAEWGTGAAGRGGGEKLVRGLWDPVCSNTRAGLGLISPKAQVTTHLGDRTRGLRALTLVLLAEVCRLQVSCYVFLIHVLPLPCSVYFSLSRQRNPEY
ncbi:receptor-transporting protein 1 [Platysternon megacephalum]|uniref:Receptor-transporting protein 1 n=1 Tax=Platysternon megacephalum TaxID=55544 RepID=A0A4D9EE23_9SAUR|nr:receptor-transporting protein 1 [Platysternon megacephalum]